MEWWQMKAFRRLGQIEGLCNFEFNVEQETWVRDMGDAIVNGDPARVKTLAHEGIDKFGDDYVKESIDEVWWLVNFYAR